MLSIATGHSIRYFTDAVAKGRESYYTGAGAAALGLEGEVDADLMEAVYTRLLDPRDPAAHSRDTWDEAAPLAAGHRKHRSADEVYDALGLIRAGRRPLSQVEAPRRRCPSLSQPSGRGSNPAVPTGLTCRNAES